MREGKIKGGKSLMGRNNVLFTLALANFSSGIDQKECEEVLSSFNENLDEALSSAEYHKIITSAYSGKYEAASHDYVMTLCKAWVNQELKASDLFVKQRWYKFKKKRADRKNSHLHEWKTDVMAYLEGFYQSEDPFIQTTKKEIREKLNIPERSLDKVLKVLKTEQKIFFTVKHGRGGGIRLASIKEILLSLIPGKERTSGSLYGQHCHFL